ncbi:MAG: hypothetical protein H0V36_05870 [Chloroflexi bacterium]|nr:hypothetical protein [Chloroflexota bacterium]
MPLLRPVAVHDVDRSAGDVTLHLGPQRGAVDWLAGSRPGDRAELDGPIGSPLRLAPRTHHLLLVTEGMAVDLVRLMAAEALRAGRQVTLLGGASSARDVYPSSLLPDEVEYVVATADGSLGQAGSVVDVVPGYEAWADQAVCAGPPALQAAMVRLAAGRDGRLGVARLGSRRGRRGGRRPRSTAPGDRSWLQCLVQPRVGCALGVCLGCVIIGASGPVRPCREGPAFPAHHLLWPESP